MIEQIVIQSGEQDLTVKYGDNYYTFQIRYNGFLNYWFVNIVGVINGLKLTIGFNSLLYLEGLGLGKLSLIDSTPESTIALDVQNDLGTRLLLYRKI